MKNNIEQSLRNFEKAVEKMNETMKKLEAITTKRNGLDEESQDLNLKIQSEQQLGCGKDVS